MKVLLGGTFSYLHKAHKEMIERGNKLGALYIGLTSDRFEKSKNYRVPSFEERKKKLESYLARNRISASISALDEPFGGTLSPEFDAMIVSNETFDFANKINFIRKSRGIKPLFLENVGTIVGEDFIPIKSERISKGIIDETGRRLNPIKIGIASRNREKIKGLKSFASKWFKDYEIQEFDNDGEIDQPFGNEIISGALSRLNQIPNDYDYAFGIEAGVIFSKGRFLDIHIAAVRDSLGKITHGVSSGILVEDGLMQLLKNGMDLERSVDYLLSMEKSGEEKGAVFYLSGGRKERWELVYESIFSAFVERFSSTIPKKI